MCAQKELRKRKNKKTARLKEKQNKQTPTFKNMKRVPTALFPDGSHSEILVLRSGGRKIFG